MTRTFLVAIELQPDEDPSFIAEEIRSILSDEFPVISVKPWSTPDPEILQPFKLA